MSTEITPARLAEIKQEAASNPPGESHLKIMEKTEVLALVAEIERLRAACEGNARDSKRLAAIQSAMVDWDLEAEVASFKVPQTQRFGLPNFVVDVADAIIAAKAKEAVGEV